MKVFYAKKKFERKKNLYINKQNKKFTFRLAEFVVNTNATYGIQQQQKIKHIFIHINSFVNFVVLD